MTSEIVPQKEAPRQRPRKSERVVKRTEVSLTPYSAERDGRVRATPWSQRLSASQPNLVSVTTLN
jgi:hypothetical protein